jgi:hypothetical protein
MLSPGERSGFRAAIKGRSQYTDFYLSSELYFGSWRFSLLDNPTTFNALLQELRTDNLRPCVWLIDDDPSAPEPYTQSWVDQAVIEIQTFVPQIDTLASSYCLGFELDDFLTVAQMHQLTNALAGVTGRAIGLHFTDGSDLRFDSGFWATTQANMHLLQLPRSFDEAELEVETDRAVAALPAGKILVGAEAHVPPATWPDGVVRSGISEDEALARGEAMVRGGARYYGNGGIS